MGDKFYKGMYCASMPSKQCAKQDKCENCIAEKTALKSMITKNSLIL